ncbi:MAG: PCRF domain-containing protein, partial [Lachnospiraceae bacterium]|nr:PCRF domain-containing protein [Lachnospiraceae bacterium]
MFDRLEDMLAKYEELMAELNDPQLALDQARYKMVMKEQANLSPIVEAYRAYKKAQETIEESEEMLGCESDEEMRELLKEELAGA